MIVRGYTLDLYCDCDTVEHPHGEFSHTFIGETYTGCARDAKRSGWRLDKHRGLAMCPECVKAGLSISPRDE